MRSKRAVGFRSILCPVDFSGHSRRALQYAAIVARRSRASLTVIYASDPLLVAAAQISLHQSSVSGRAGGELRAFIAAALRKGTARGLRVHAWVSVGPAPEEIAKAAVRHRCDLIVMGTHGLTGSQRLLVGSTTARVLQNTTIPVLAVPPTRRGSRRVPEDWPGERILAAVELDRSGRADVARAATLAERFGASLLLLQVASSRSAHEIAAVVAAERIQLVITPLKDRRGWFGANRGSLPYHVLSHAFAPVLAYPARWRPR